MKNVALIMASFLFICMSSLDVNAQNSELEKKTKQETEQIEVKTPLEVTEKQPDKRGYIVKVGDKAPQFELTLDDGKVVKSEDLKGKVVMLQFTASWCGVCRKEMPHIEADIWQKLKDNPDFVVIGVDRDEPLEKVLQLKEQTKVTYPLALDPGADVFALFASKKSGVTRNVIIDQNGEIVFLTRLFEQTEFDAMKDKIFSLLEE